MEVAFKMAVITIAVCAVVSTVGSFVILWRMKPWKC